MIRARNTGMVGVDHRVILTPNGLNAGEYTAPAFELIFSEAVPPGGAPPPPNCVENLPFLVSGEGPYNGLAPTGQISPWPSLVAPLTTTSCAAPPPPPPPPPPGGTAAPVANADTLSITGATLSINAATLLANDTGTTLAVAGVAPISFNGGTITGTGPYVYTPAAGFVGIDTFTYQIRDAFGQTAVGTVNVTRATTITVPNVVNQPRALAQSTITGAGLTNGAVTSANSLTVAIGSVISESPAAGSSVAPGTAVSLVVSLGPAGVTVPTVVHQTPAAAQSAQTPAGLTNGAVTSANSLTVAIGSVISQNPAGGASVAPGTAVSLVVSLGPAATGGNPTVQTSVSADGTGARAVALSTTPAGEVLNALIGSDGPTTGANTQNITVSGAGLAWTRVQRAATSRGVSEIWTATAPAVLTNAIVTSTQSVTTVLGAPVNQSLLVIAFTNASGVGASAVAANTSTNATASLATQAIGSFVFGVGNDFDRAVARTVGAGQTKLHEFLAPTGDTFWMQSVNAASTTVGQTITVNATAAGAADQWNLAIVEIKR